MQKRVLELLKAADGFISGEDISRQLGVTRTSVWKAINVLRKEGYVVESVTNRGYCLREVPDLLNVAEITEGLKTAVLGRTVVALPVVDSTNNEAKRQAAKGAAHGTLFVAEQQTGGKGRLGRSWDLPARQGICMSLLLRPKISPYEVPRITLLAGLAVCRAIRALTPCPAMIKWPNDVIIGRKKVCGILTEMTAETERVDFVATGIGINVNNPSFPEQLHQKATSLYLETGEKYSRTALLRQVLYELETCYDAFLTETTADLLTPYKELCATLGRKIGYTRNGKTFIATAVDISRRGGLLVMLENGKKAEINSGEVTVQGIY